MPRELFAQAPTAVNERSRSTLHDVCAYQRGFSCLRSREAGGCGNQVTGQDAAANYRRVESKVK